jgi:hypothetical protein
MPRAKAKPSPRPFPRGRGRKIRRSPREIVLALLIGVVKLRQGANWNCSRRVSYNVVDLAGATKKRFRRKGAI